MKAVRSTFSASPLIPQAQSAIVAKPSQAERDDGPADPKAGYENLPFLGTVTEIGIVLLSEYLRDPVHGQYLNVT
jgi:hypothetical protein